MLLRFGVFRANNDNWLLAVMSNMSRYRTEKNSLEGTLSMRADDNSSCLNLICVAAVHTEGVRTKKGPRETHNAHLLDNTVPSVT